MKRLHVHVNVEDLSASVRFYSTLFGADPSVTKGDYAKWMLDDPRVNFAISERGRAAGIDHLGLQADTREELDEISARLERAQAEVVTEQSASCCYAVSDKTWSADPQGVAWESFYSYGESTVYGDDSLDSESVPHFKGEPAKSCCPG